MVSGVIVVVLVSVSDMLLNNLILAETRPVVEELGGFILDSLSRHWGRKLGGIYKVILLKIVDKENSCPNLQF